MVQAKSVTPFFSIITCTKNSEKFIDTCLKSVKAQTFRDFEHIIIDGHSTDATLEIASRTNAIIISAEPRGIAHAMNLGIARACGQYLYFLNSDDSFYNFDVLSQVHDYLLEHSDLHWAYGKIHETDGVHTIGFPPKRKVFQGKHPTILKFYNYIPHQATFIKKTVFAKYGKFDESLRTMLDPEYWLRIAPHTAWDYLPIVVANYLVRSDAQSVDESNKLANSKELKVIRAKYLSYLERLIANVITWISKL